jgi:outer membrane lipoprotein
MTKHRLLGVLALGLIVLMDSGCATNPIAKEYRQQAAAEDVTFSMVLSNPDAYVGDVVLWGGFIIKTQNLKNATNITVLESPLQGSERPSARDYSSGRFIARSSKLLDPEIYRPGKKITVAGVVSGKETHPLGKTTYTYPVISVKQMVLWKPYRRYAYPSYWGPFWSPYWGPYWRWGPGYGYYGDDEEGFEGEDHEHFRNEREGAEDEHFGNERERAEHGEGGGDQR